MTSAAFLIYSGIMPLIKTFIAILLGYVLAKMGLFTPAAARGASQVTMNVSLPGLIFASIVPAFTPSNVGAIGPLLLISFAYQFFGFAFGTIIREVCYVPRNFWQGIIILTGMSNWGNLPTAVVISVTQSPPFNPATDPALGVSYVSIFILSYFIIFWMAGGAHSLSWDYLPGVPQGEEAERRLPWKEKPLGRLVAAHVLRLPPPIPREVATRGAKDEEACLDDREKSQCSAKIDVPLASPLTHNEKQDQSASAIGNPEMQIARRTCTSIVSVPASHRTRRPSAVSQTTSPIPAPAPAPSPQPSPSPSLLRRALQPLMVMVSPITIAIVVALPIALVDPLKALFVDISASGGPAWKAPDGRPPLAFIIDTAQFIGDIAVPLALILLGASFARLRVPRPWSRLPIAAMLAVSVAKMVVMPVIGVLMVQAMVHAGLIAHDAKAEKFVAMFLSGTPAAVNQLIISSLYAPDGDVETLSAFLLVQYVFMFFSSSALTAVSLLLL